MTTYFNLDTSSYREFVIQDTLRVSTDSANTQIPVDTVFDEIPIYEATKVDSVISAVIATPRISVNRSAPTAEITTVLPNYTVPDLYENSANRFPFQFVQKNNKLQSERKERIEKSLRSGEALPTIPFRNDWTICVIILSIILFSTVYASVKTLFPYIFRFFLFRETQGEGKKAGELFRWKSIFLNAASFIFISIFIYFAVSYNNIVPDSFSGFKIWLFSVAIITILLTIRHFICATTGLLSGKTAIFDDYIFTVYQAYRFAGFFLFFLITLFFYTPLITAKSCLIIGSIIIASLYLIRILRLFLLFIKHKVSILYLILYLCALEFLPVLVSIKYFSGLM